MTPYEFLRDLERERKALDKAFEESVGVNRLQTLVYSHVLVHHDSVVRRYREQVIAYLPLEVGHEKPPVPQRE